MFCGGAYGWAMTKGDSTVDGEFMGADEEVRPKLANAGVG
jgi:hypothetical protein